MTENEAIARFKSCQENAGNCEKCRFYSCCGIYDMEDLAIKALKEVQEYRKIGTPEECRESVERSNEKTRIIDGVTECCGYDFGIDAFQMGLSKFCPVCGKKIERSDEE